MTGFEAFAYLLLFVLVLLVVVRVIFALCTLPGKLDRIAKNQHGSPARTAGTACSLCGAIIPPFAGRTSCPSCGALAANPVGQVPVDAPRPVIDIEECLPHVGQCRRCGQQIRFPAGRKAGSCPQCRAPVSI